MAKRKTVKVEDIRTQVNSMIAESTCSPDGRQGMIQVLTELLHQSGNYNGFRYMLPDEVPAGHRPGINNNISDDVTHDDLTEARFKNTDPTRVQYL